MNNLPEVNIIIKIPKDCKRVKRILEICRVSTDYGLNQFISGLSYLDSSYMASVT